MTDDPPRTVYKLVSADAWRAAQASGTVAWSAADVRDGFMHLSTRAQLLETAARHFAGERALVALEIALAEIADKVKFELAPKRGETFPHLYGALPAAKVRRVLALAPSGDGRFTLPEDERA